MTLIERTDLGTNKYVETYEDDEYRYVKTVDGPRIQVEAVCKYPYRPSVSIIDGGSASVSFETGPFTEELIDERIARLEKTKDLIRKIKKAFFYA